MRDVHAHAEPVAAPAVDAYKRRLERERQARAAAEAIIEEKSRELFAANQQLEQLLSASVKVLTDVLSMARPEVFQKAGKVQRWARRIAPHLEIERPWELDLAAMLYPLGTLSLPDDIASRHVLGDALSEAEQTLVAESSQAAHDLLCNIPRMETVAHAVLYCRKGFDGSGYPEDDVAGKDIPKPARVLKILIDLADDATGADRTRDFKAMAKRKQLYDLDILAVAYKHLRRGKGQPDAEGKVVSVTQGMLRPNDVVHRDIIDSNNKLLLASGAKLSQITIQRLRAHCVESGEIGEIEVVRQ